MAKEPAGTTLLEGLRCMSEPGRSTFPRSALRITAPMAACTEFGVWSVATPREIPEGPSQ